MTDSSNNGDELRAKRDRFRASVEAMRNSLDDELGVRPSSSWFLPVLASAVGLTMGSALRKRLSGWRRKNRD